MKLLSASAATPIPMEAPAVAPQPCVYEDARVGVDADVTPSLHGGVHLADTKSGACSHRQGEPALEGVINRAAGEALVRGEPAEAGGRVAEGLPATVRLVSWARGAGIELPLAEAVQAVLSGELAPGEALVARPFKAEDL